MKKRDYKTRQKRELKEYPEVIRFLNRSRRVRKFWRAQLRLRWWR